MTLPDYRGGSIVNLMRSIGASFGGISSIYSPLSSLPWDPQRLSSHIVLIVVDGLGYHYLRQVQGVEVLNQHLYGALTSVFPSTTATGVTTFLTGVPAQQHGLTGWHMYLEEIGESAAILPFETRAEGRSLLQLGVKPEGFFDYPTFFEQLDAQCHALSPDSIAHSPFNRRHTRGACIEPYRSLTQFFEGIERLTRAQDRRRYVYAYFPEFDTSAHEYGLASPVTRDVLRRFSAGFERLLRVLAGRDVTLLVTADHGFVDVPPAQRLELQDHPHLQACLAQPLCGERRLPYCYVRQDKHAQFTAYIANELGHACEAVPSAQLIAQEYFGMGTPHPHLARRAGDFALMMRDGFTLKDWISGEQRHTLIGVHGGVSENEMRVPLIYAAP